MCGRVVVVGESFGFGEADDPVGRKARFGILYSGVGGDLRMTEVMVGGGCKEGLTIMLSWVEEEDEDQKLVELQDGCWCM